MSQRGDHGGDDGQGPVDIRVRGVVTEGEPDGTTGQRARHTHGRQHVTRLEGPAGTGRSTRDTDTPLAQGEQELLTLVHELTHVMAHGASASSRTQRTVCEYEAEAVECLIAQRLGFGASGFEAFTGEVCTFPDGLLADSVARVGAVASTLLAVLDRQPLARFTP